MKQKIKISGTQNLLWLLALTLIIALGIYLVKDAIPPRGAAEALGGNVIYTPPNSSFADLLR